MRVLIVGQFTGTGGAERSLMPLAHCWAAQGIELTLLLLRSPNQFALFETFPGTVVILSGRWSKLRSLADAIASHDLIIVTSELTPTYLTWGLNQWHRKPLIADVQVVLSRWIDDTTNPIHHWLCDWIYPRISFIRCVANGVAEDLQTRYHVASDRLSVIYVPFDLEAIQQAADQPLPPEHQKWFQSRTIVASGRFTTQKRFDRAISALQHLRQDGAIDVQLLILGDGELRPQLKQQIQQTGLSDYVHLMGFVENPHAYVRQADVFLLSSDYEGLPRVLIEALAIGIPIVSTDCPSGPAEILGDNQWGIVVKPKDPIAIAAALAKVLQDPDLANQLRQAGPQRAQMFSTEAIAQQYQDLIQQAMQRYEDRN